MTGNTISRLPTVFCTHPAQSATTHELLVIIMSLKRSILTNLHGMRSRDTSQCQYSFFITSLLVPIQLRLPMFYLTFSSAVINSMTSVACIKFVLWWIVWSVAGCTFKRFWNERGCCSSFFFVHDLEILDGLLVSLLC